MQFCIGRGIDIGAGKWPFPGARPIEQGGAENAFKINELDGSVDYVFSSHCLEHLDNWGDALAEWARVIRPGGVIYLYLPHPAAELWNKENMIFHKWNPSPGVVSDRLKALGFSMLEISYFPDAYLSFYVVARKIVGLAENSK